MKSYVSRETFCQATKEKHAASFELHSTIANALQPLVVHSRRVETPLETAIDFLFIQAYKAHEAVALLAENGLIEDAATVTRRLLEIGVQAVYIGGDSEHVECESRAGRYLAFLWRETPLQAKAIVSPAAVAHWDKIEETFGKDIPPNAKRWGPSFKAMFKYAQREDTYVVDYSLLSRISHGSPEEFIIQYSADRFRLRSTLHAPAVLGFASRYYLGVAGVWNRHFKILTADRIDELCSLVLDEDVPARATEHG